MTNIKPDIFVGRQDSISYLENLIRQNLNDSDKRIRIISIFGKSGVGKSYLVSHVLNRIGEDLRRQLILKIWHSKNTNSLATIFTNQLIDNSEVSSRRFKRLGRFRKVVEAIDKKFLVKTIKDESRIAELREKLFSDASYSTFAQK